MHFAISNMCLIFDSICQFFEYNVFNQEKLNNSLKLAQITTLIKIKTKH